MGILSLVSQWRRRRRAQGATVKSTAGGDGRRLCRFERIEQRYLLSGAPIIQLGAVYQDAASGQDAIPNTFTVSWSGGAAGTQLTQLTIETDPNGAVTVQPGDPFFNTAPGPPGVYGYSPLSIVSSNGFTVTGQNPVNGSTVLVLNFNGFTAGKELVFTIDVDDMGPHGADATVNGHEFEDSKLIGLFSAPHYEDFTANGTFYDSFNPQLQASGITNLPDDSYVAGPITPGGPSYPAGLIGGTTPNTTPDSVYTAGAFGSGQQTPLPISLEGDVYYNPELDNARHTDDPGIAGVQLTLLENVSGAYVATGMTTVTDANGHYKFSGILPGDYEIAETQPGGYFAVGSSAGSYSGSTYGVSVNANLLNQIDVLGGESVANLDFSQSLPNSLSGTVRVPPIGNCDTDASAPPLAGVTIQLLNSGGGVLATTTTAADGSYIFTNLKPGDYTVHELMPAGYFAVDDHVGSVGGTIVDLQTLGNIVLTSNEKGASYDFCIQQPVSIAGTVRVPPVGKCDTDTNAPPLGGVTVQLLDSTGKVVGTTTTAADGTYSFKNLTPGTYSVHEVLPAGYFAVDDHVGTDGGTLVDVQTIGSVTLTSGQDGTQYDFCIQQPVSISGTVRVPPTGTCDTDTNSPPLGGVTVQLLDGSGNVLQTTTTAADGTYTFQNLKPGTYSVHEVLPTGYYAVDDHVGSDGGTLVDLQTVASISLTSGQNGAQYDFCIQQPVSIRGTVLVPPTGNCDTNSNSQPLAGVTVQLLDSGGNVLQTTTTAADGTYSFQNLKPGTYTVHEVLPAGYYAVDDHVGTDGGTLVDLQTVASISLTSGQNGTQYDFCIQQPVSIHGTVLVPPNGNCDTDPNAPPLAGVTIQLLDSSGNVLQTTTTAADGTYSFSGLKPGAYTVHEIPPAGYVAADDHVGSVGGTAVNLQTIANVSLTSGQSGVGYDFCVVQPTSISGQVLIPPIGNCDTDPSAPPAAGITVQLLDSNGNLLATTTTAADGTYSFQNLMPGNYTVHEIMPAGYYAVDDHVGTAGGTATDLQTLAGAVLTSGVSAVHYDFCIQQPVSISGIVRSDIYGDCETHPNDPPVSGVTIQLLDANGNVIATTTTDANGIYTFSNLQPGTYGVHELLPTGYFDGDTHVGSAGGTITGQDLVTGITLISGTAGSSYNFCVTPGGTISGLVFQDGPAIVVANPATDTTQVLKQLPTMRTGIFQPGDATIAGVTLELADEAGQILLDSHGNPVQTTTDANGFYQFTGLPPGTYTVVEVPPSGFLPGIDTAGTLGGLAINPTLVGLGAQSLDLSAEGALLQSIGSDNAITMIVLGAGQSSQQNNFSVIVVVPLALQTPAPALPQLPGLSPAPPAALAQVPSVYALPAPTPPPVYSRGGVLGVTWHLSVIDAGMARGSRGAPQTWLHLTNTRLSSAAWRNHQLKESLWTLYPEQDEQDEPQQVRFGRCGCTPVTGDFNGDGVSDVGVYIDGQWFIDLNGNGVWDQGDLWAKLGSRDDKPITGDWDGDGKTDIGVFGRAWPGDPRAVAEEPGLPDPHNPATGVPKNMPPSDRRATLARRTMQCTSEGELRADAIDHVFHFGTPGDIPVTGDWTGCGIDSIGIFRDGQWVLDLDGDGKRTDRDRTYIMGQKGDQPIVGDFDGDGVDELGLYRDGVWLIDINHDGQLDERDLRYELGGPGDRPVVGDWNGDGVDQIGVHRDEAAPAEES